MSGPATVDINDGGAGIRFNFQVSHRYEPSRGTNGSITLSATTCCLCTKRRIVTPSPRGPTESGCGMVRSTDAIGTIGSRLNATSNVMPAAMHRQSGTGS